MRAVLLLIMIAASNFSMAENDSLQWIRKLNTAYNLFYTKPDNQIVELLETDTEKGIKEIKDFFGDNGFEKFDVYIYPERTSLDKQWQKDWNMPDFKSECWMVASGVAHRLDILSPLSWSKDACQHHGDDSIEVQQIISHELTHVFHAQHCANHIFDGMDDYAWLIEGVATYVSGQLTDAKIRSVKDNISAGKSPEKLADFWKGNTRYQQAGSLIKYIDEKYGREKLYELLKLTKLDEMLNMLHTTEKDLVAGWKDHYK